MYPSHLYYNKKFDKVKHFNILEHFHFEFKKIFESGLPRFFDAVDKKNSKKNIIPKKNGLFKNFIFFNSKVIKFLIVDVDTKENFGNKYEIFEFLNDYNIAPTWILETDKGYHIGFILKDAIPFENEKARNFAFDVLKKLSLLLGGDINALRLKGRFRNPLKHDTFYTLNEYTLNELNEGIPYFILSDIEIKHNENKKVHKDVLKLKELILKVLNNINFIKNVNKGYRNSFLWYTGMIIAKQGQHLPNPQKILFFEKVKEKIYFYNNNLNEPLDKKEVDTILNSVKKYYLKGKIMVGIGSYNNWNKEMKSIYMKEYRKKKGIIKEHREEKKAKNKNLVLQSIYTLKKENKKITVRNIKKICGLANATISKYIKELKEDPKFSVLFN